MITATNFEKQLSIGSTRPFLINTNDGPYVCKLYEEDIGNLHIINEFICAKIAIILGLPLAPFDFVAIDQDIIEKNENLSERNILSSIAFGSKWEKDSQTNINPPLLDSCTNADIIPNIILFDQIILNEDRATNDGNLLFNVKKKELVVIDHTHAFPGQTIWNESTLRQDKDKLIVKNFNLKYYRMLIRYIKGNSPFHNVCEKSKSITRENLTDIMNEIPEEWNFSDEQKTNLTDFLLHRINILPSILDEISNYCPQWKGGK